MLRKKEKKAITSTIALLIGWPVGLDQFLEGSVETGIAAIIGWTANIIFLVVGLNQIDFWDVETYGYFILGIIGTLIGLILILKRLINLLRDFEEAED